MKKFFNKYITAILIFYAFWMGGLPIIFSKMLPVVCQKISRNSAYELEILQPKLRLGILPTAEVIAGKIKIKEKATNDYTTVEQFKVKIRLLPLLSGHIHINKISADNLVINSTLKDKIELDKDFIYNITKAKIKCDKVSLNEFMISLWQKNIKSPIIYTGKNIRYTKNGRFLYINIDSKIDIQNSISNAKVNLFLPENNNIQKSTIDIKITNFNIEPLGAYLKQYLPKDFVAAKGIIDINVDKHHLTALMKNCSILMKDEAKSIIFPNVMNISSNFSLTSKLINFDNFDIKSKNINATLKGTVSNYLDKAITEINLNVELNKSRVEDIVNLLPPIIVEEFNVYKLKKYKFYGDTIGNFSIKGTLPEPEIYGDIFIDNGILIAPIKNARGAVIKLNFTGKYVNFDVTVPAGGTEKVLVKGGVELYNVKYADMHIWSTQKVDLQTAEEKVVPLHEILNFIIGPVPIMNVKGDGNINIIVKGNRKTPHVWGVLNFHNVTTYFNEIPNLILTNADAVLKFNDQMAEFKTRRGLVNKKNIDIHGTCNLYGKFDFNVISKEQELEYLYNAIKTSGKLLDDIKKMLPPTNICKGNVNLDLKVYGEVKYIEDLVFNKNCFSDGKIEFLDNTLGMQGITIKNTKGTLNLDKTNATANIKALLGNSPISAVANVKNNIADLNISIPRLNLNDITPDKTDLQKDLGNIFLKVDAKYKGKINEIEYDKVNFDAKILGTTKENKLKLSNGEITLNNNRLSVRNIKGSILDTQSLFDINLNADNVSNNPNFNGAIKLTGFELSNINSLTSYSIIPEDVKKTLNLIKFDRGRINLNCRINNNKVNFYTDLGGISFQYIPLNLPIKIVNGSLIMRNNNLRLNKINLLADEMPILADGTVNEVFSKQNFDMYFNTKPKQEFIDKYVNKNQIYPIKIKGDIVCSAKVRGIKDNFDLKSNIRMAKDSSIYHLGATVGDVENSIILDIDTKILKQNIMKIREFSYDKIIPSQGSRQTRLNMLKAHGGIEVFKDDLAFDDLYIKTQNPTDARIFNIIFRKPNIKQGQFTSDLRFNGRLSNPKLLGTFHIFETNIPFLDTTMKNINFNFKDKTVELFSKGEILGNDITIQCVLKNKLTPPYYVEKAFLNTKLLDLNYIINKLKLSQVDNYQTFESFEGFDLSTLVIKNLVLSADSIHLRNIVAENFESSASLNEDKLIDVDNFKFNIANGSLRGTFKFNLNNNDTLLKLKANSIDANALSIALFDLNNQMYGDLTGDINLSCNGTNFDNCMKTLNGKTSFNVSDGRMPKLGSLEYLLKAGNLIKGGITGLSINSVIDIITPLKTGEFSDIYGNMLIKEGVADRIEITTRGKDLSLFISGKYNFSTAIADMEVFGMLSKKISTMFGPIGNLSLNTLFNAIPGVDLSKNTEILDKINKIPGIELSGKAYRRFIAEIKGNINGEDYVTSFKWIN